MTVIKRYANRKLYDTERKRYVTLEDIADRVRQGQDVRVVDNETGEDLTAVTLAQIIMEMERRQAGMFPTGLLTQLIRTGEMTFTQVSESLGRLDQYVEQVLRRLNVPTRADFQRLQAEVEALVERVDALTQGAETTDRVTPGDSKDG